VKKKLAALAITLFALSTANGTVFNYDFESSTGTHTSGASTTFLPTPSTGGGTARVRVGSGGGSFTLANPGDINLGTGSELQMVASSSSSVNKFSIYDYTPAKSFSLAMTLKLSGGSSGKFQLFTGDGSCFSNDSGFTGTEVFSGIEWGFGTENSIATSYRNAGNWTALGSNPFNQTTLYNIEIYGNNTTETIQYTRGDTRSVAANTWDLWVNGSLIGNNLAKAQLANDADIDSFMVIGQSSTGNVATFTVDDIRYANEITVIPEPGTLILTGLGLLGAMLVRKLRY